MLAALGGHFGWPRAELEALTGEDAQFWHQAAADLAELQNRER